MMCDDFMMWKQRGWRHEMCDGYRRVCGNSPAGDMKCVMATDVYVKTARLAT